MNADQADVEIVMWRIMRLPRRSQLELYRQLADLLAGSETVPNEQEDAIVRQHEALAAMLQVAEVLELPVGQAPTTGQFDAQARALGLPWTVSSVGRAFSKRSGWRLATQAFVGGRLPEPARYVRQRRYLSRRRGGRIEHLALVKEWLDAQSDDNHTIESYMLWRDKRNRELKGTNQPLIVGAKYLASAFPELGWPNIVAAADGNVEDISELSRQLAEQRLRTETNPLHLVGTSTAAALLGMTGHALRAEVTARPERLPTVVMTVGKRYAMLEKDVRAHAAGKRYPRRRVGELNDRIRNTLGIARLLGVSHKTVAKACQEEDWRHIPKPAGQYSNMLYWLTENVERWRAKHPPKRAP